MELTGVGWLNILLVFSLAGCYSFIELLNIFNSARSFFKSFWGSIYVILNGLLAVLALLVTFNNEFNQNFLGAKILIAGTSSLALLRVIVIPIKHGSTGNNIMPIIDIVLNHVKKAYDRERSRIDLKDIVPIMKGIDYQKAAESLPLLCSNLLRTLSEQDGEKMNEEIQKLLTLEEGSKEIKAINLGSVLAKYIGIDLLKHTVDATKEYLTIDNSEEIRKKTDNDLDLLIEKFS